MQIDIYKSKNVFFLCRYWVLYSSLFSPFGILLSHLEILFFYFLKCVCQLSTGTVDKDSVATDASTDKASSTLTIP